MSGCRPHDWVVTAAGLRCRRCERETPFEQIPMPALGRIVQAMKTRKSPARARRFEANFIKARTKALGPPPSPPDTFTDKVMGRSFEQHLADLKHPGAGKGGKAPSKW